jgi:hypothetical protein
MILLTLGRFTESRDANTGVAYAMATLHEVFWLSLKAYEAIDVGI